MILVVDGYNFVKQIFKDLMITDSFRMSIIQKFNNYAKNKNHQVVLVFDGGQSAYPTKEKICEVLVVYSGYKDSADDVIKNYISENKNSDLLLVTSDRELRNFATKIGIESIAVLDFNRFFIESSMQKKQVIDKTLHKTTSSKCYELDELMSESTNKVEVKSEDLDYMIKDTKKSKTISKEEKKLIQKLKKL